jgi:hypothetical protein
MNFAGPSGLTWVFLLACSVITCGGTPFGNIDATNAESNPYLIISRRNVFHLHAPPPPAPVADKSATLPEVMLTGFVETAHVTTVLLAKPAEEPAKTPTYLSLKAGERKDGVEVVRIRLQKEEVDIINSGTPMTLCLNSNSFPSDGFALKAFGGAQAKGFPETSPASPVTRLALSKASRRPFPETRPTDSSSGSTTSQSSSVFVLGGGFGAPAMPPQASSNPGLPNSGLPPSGAGIGMPGLPSTALSPSAPGNGGSSAIGAGLSSPPMSLPESEMTKWLASQANLNSPMKPSH